MIGRESPPTAKSADIPTASAAPERPTGPPRESAVRWGIGCLVGAVSLAGVLLLSLVLALYLQPPAWVQVVVGVVLVVGAILLAWLVATAWGRAARAEGRD